MDLIAQQILVLCVFTALMLWLNLKAGNATHWSSAILKVVSYVLILLSIAGIFWKLWGFIL